jgi:hypothetical protein
VRTEGRCDSLRTNPDTKLRNSARFVQSCWFRVGAVKLQVCADLCRKYADSRRSNAGSNAENLRAIATAKVEELIYQLRENFTIVIVTHNMQQAGRCSNYTAFFYLGRLIEFGATSKIFSNPSERKTEDYITGRFG